MATNMTLPTPTPPSAPSDATPEGAGFKWQPIETAPRDGTLILLGGGFFDCEFRSAGTIRAPGVASWEKNKHGGFWLIVGSEGGYVCVLYEEPTHWMPLPPPPTPAPSVEG